MNKMYCTFIHFASTYLDYLPIMQKTLIVLVIIWMVGLVYFTVREDFQR